MHTGNIFGRPSNGAATIYNNLNASLLNVWKIPNKDCQIGETSFSTLLSSSG